MVLPQLLLGLALSVSAPQEHSRKAAIDDAIRRGVDYLVSKQVDGAWSYSGRARPGATALAAFALLKSGVAPSHPSVSQAVAWLAVQRVDRTYDTAFAILMLTTLEAEEHRDWIEELAGALLTWQESGGDWGYPRGADLSNTQYAGLGLYAAALAKVEVPSDVWIDLGNSLRAYGSEDGGFGYRRDSTRGTPTMTVAGVGTLAICASMLQRAGELSSEEANGLRRRTDKATAWLDEHFKAVISIRGAWSFYRYYGMERMGAYLGLSRIGDHDWYREGALALLAAQNGNGSWGKEDSAGSEVQTAFALLFLNRATSFPGTGRSTSSSRTKHVFGTHSKTEDVQVRATGQDPLTLWISGWGPDVIDRYEWRGDRGRGPRVERVVYLAGERVIDIVFGDADEPADTRRFETRHHLPFAGTYDLRARVYVVTPPAQAGARPTHAVLESQAFPVTIEDLEPAWTGEQAGDRTRNLLPAGRPTVRASSELDSSTLEAVRACPVDFAVDNRQRTSWLADPADPEPTLVIELDNPQRADLLLISSAHPVPHQRGLFARPLEIEVRINGAEPLRLRMPPDEWRKGRIELEQPVQIHELELRIPWKVEGEKPWVGLAEVELQLR